MKLESVKEIEMQNVKIEKTWKLKHNEETYTVPGNLVTIHYIYAFAHTTGRAPTHGWRWRFCFKTIFTPDDYLKTMPLKERISKVREYRRKLFSTWHTRRRTVYNFEAVATVDGKFETFLWDDFREELMCEIWEEITTDKQKCKRGKAA
tara:strand:- start:117 stop:563 length:447 start_codon:yes stop_codon:yes gene_type:complete